MPTQMHRYTLVGFSDELDWREVNFVEPIPRSRICQACGLVTRVTGLLPCRHVFCKKCYEQCRSEDGHCCLLDGEQVLADDVEWMECPVHNLLKRKVKCWNEDRGCGMVLAASELSKHFSKDCDHHSTSCPRCSSVVLCSDVCRHIQSECRDHASSVVPGAAQTITGDKNEIIVALNADINMEAAKIEGRLDQIVNENNCQSNRLEEISHSVNMMKEKLLEISRSNVQESVALSLEAIHETLNGQGENLQLLAGTITKSHEILKEALDGTKLSVEQLKENAGNILRDVLRELSAERSALTETFRKELQDATNTVCSNDSATFASIVDVKDCKRQTNSSAVNVERILPLSTINVMRHEFTVERFKETKESAVSVGYHLYEEKEMYLSGYHLSPGVLFKMVEENVLLCPSIKVNKGIIDNVLQWPFNKDFGLTLKHPSQKKDCQKVAVTSQDAQWFARPDKESNPGCHYAGSSFRLGDLEREGYIVDNKLRVVWELFPKTNEGK
ncbi:TNF receptor-associated factor 6 [Rhipicephalus sanguineus]|uniref:TNF receptor-associated factor 6 n=1 Tax=Rhipicephalus sanguineus TaxID=34632 RepID=UPI00189381AB|nr:TNF receptor-associated factor 6 [Rhipicephalus sanguineus]